MIRLTSSAIFLLSLISGIMAVGPCRKFVCKNPVDPQNPDVCAKIEKISDTEWIEDVGQCEKEKTCRMSEVDDLTIRCTPSIDFFKWPGQKCSDVKLCYGKRVEGGFCRGAQTGEKCTTHWDCDVGLRCGFESLCEPAGEEEAHCSSDQLCQSYLYCLEGTCIRYGTIENGHSVGRGGADLCQSRYKNKHDVCETGPNLKGEVIVGSNKDKCLYSNDEEEYAACGFHGDGKAICKPGMGDTVMIKEWEELQKYLNNKPKCSPYLVDMGQCDYAITMGDRQYYRGRIAYNKLHYYSQIQHVPDCLQRYVHADYFELEKGYNSGLGVSTLLAVILGILLILL